MPHPYLAGPRPLVIGHRGCAGEAPENTLPSFERALAQGAAILETDVHLSRDGVPVLIHDDRVDRVSDRTGAVRDLELAELRRLDFGYRFSPDGGRSHPFRGRGVGIATLDEALARLPGARLNLELKEDLPGLAEGCLERIAAAKREARCLLTAADAGLMTRLRGAIERAGSRVAQGASAGDVLAFVRSAQEDTAPPPGPDALQVPAEFGGAPLVTRAFVDHAHRHGLQVHVWTVNEPAEMTRLLDLGVDGLVTDHPGRMARLVAERARD